MRRLIGLLVLVCLSFIAMGTVTPSHAQSHQVVLYVAEYCSHCRLAEQYLLERGVKVEIRDITQSARFHHEWKDIYHGDIVPVLVLDQGQPQRRLVTIGRKDSVNVEIRAGLQEGDRVVMGDSMSAAAAQANSSERRGPPPRG